MVASLKNRHVTWISKICTPRMCKILLKRAAIEKLVDIWSVFGRFQTNFVIDYLRDSPVTIMIIVIKPKLSLNSPEETVSYIAKTDMR